MPATAKTQTIGGQQVNTAEMTGFNFSMVFKAIERALEAPTSTAVVILGQSNAAGRAPIATLNAVYDNDYENVQIWNSVSGDFVNLNKNNSMSDNADQYGFEMSLGYHLNDIGGKHYIIKYAVGGSQLDYSPTGNSWFSKFGKLLREAVEDYITPALAKIPNLGAVNVVWCQGEADSLNTKLGFVDRYYTNLRDTFKNLQNYAPISKFIIVKTNANLVTPYDNVDDIIAAQQKVAADTQNCTILDVDSQPLADGVHYTGAAYEAIGLEVGNEIVIGKITAPPLEYKPWLKVPIIDFRQDSHGATTTQVTPVTTTNCEAIDSPGLGRGLRLTGTSASGPRTFAIAKADGLHTKNFELDFEITSALTDIVVFACATNNAGNVTGILFRISNNETRTYSADASSNTLLFTAPLVLSNDTRYQFTCRYENGLVQGYITAPDGTVNRAYEGLVGEHTGSEVFVACGMGGTDETRGRFGNIRTIVDK